MREGFGVQLDQPMEGKVHRREFSTRAVDQRRGGRDHTAVFFHDVDGFQEASAAGDDVFDDDEAFAGFDLEPAAQDECSLVVLFGKDMRLAQLAGDFLSDQDAAEGGGDDGVAVDAAELIGEGGADLLGDFRIAEEQRALEKFAAVQAGAQDEMSMQQRTGLAEEGEEVGLGHGKIQSRRRG